MERENKEKFIHLRVSYEQKARKKLSRFQSIWKIILELSGERVATYNSNILKRIDLKVVENIFLINLRSFSSA